MRYFLTLVICLTCIVKPAKADNSNILDDRLVEIIVTYQTYNEIMPWLGNTPQTRYGYAVFLNENTLITTENLVRNHQLIEIRKARTGTKIPAKVKISDTQVNLALLTIEQPEKNMPPLPVSDKVPMNSPVKIIQFDETSQIQRSMATVLHSKMASLPNAPYNALTFQLLVDVEINGDGVGVLFENKLAGIIMSYNRSARTASMIPYLTINSFLERANQTPYTGFARAGFQWKPLLDPAKRKFLKADDPDTGVLVLTCMPGTGSFNVLQPEDVILKWDGYAIDNLGFYDDPEFGRISISHLIKDKKTSSDKADITVLRKGKALSLSLNLSQITDDNALVPEDVTGEKASYVIEGGLILREVTGRYLHAYGAKWQRKLNARLVNHYYDQNQDPDNLDKRIVILVRVLPDPINIGYQTLNNLAVTKVNNQPINNLEDVFRIADKDGNITRITTDLLGVDIVLDESELELANKRIAANYRIPALRYQKPVITNP